MADIKPADPSSPVASTPQAPGPNDVKLEAQIKSADMAEDMQQEVIEIEHQVLTCTTAQAAMQKYTIEKYFIRVSKAKIHMQFDDRKGPTWHCIVGRNFGSFVTHETKHFLYFYLGHCAILLFKTQ
ncbi:Dynein light chain, cytoplasmic [Ceratocystis fimbriata CBS 114723]|uniref:Dynein light chain n=1 Tax=Ceratocystis fimbriata CBS 114723 TaxID=1035309 RepID=A0A2C5WX88_9PEZI|nr:Dynein light chain, cytoplasmic [Ceratocystis fimbriata CBS 114723]